MDYYTCTMHPSVHSHDPHGKCPICAMDLVPVLKHGAQAQAPKENSAALSEFVVPVERRQQIGVTYAEVTRAPLQRTIRSVGSVSVDRTRQWQYVTRVEGYVQTLHVTSPGETVEKNQPLVTIYSPDLLTTEQVFLYALEERDHAASPGTKARAAHEMEVARIRLEQWNVTAEQVAELERSRTASQYLTLRSPFRGVVESVPVEQGRRIMAGDLLVSVADLSEVWIWADFYENEIALLKPGVPVLAGCEAYPNETFRGVLALVNPFLSVTQRIARARLDVKNPDFKLRPGMFVHVTLEVNSGEGLAVPLAAILPTGTRSLAFVDKGEGKLEPRAVQLGEKYGELYEIKGGLKLGERVVASANFLIDAESKVQGAVKSFEEPEPSAALPPGDLAAAESLLEPYFAIERELAQDSLQGVPEARAKIKQIATSLPDGTRPLHLKEFADAVDQFRVGSLEEARVGFGKLSAALIALLGDLPALKQDLYVLNCSMWHESPAHWLQTSAKIENPFMGRRMSSCGEVVKTLAHPQ